MTTPAGCSTCGADALLWAHGDEPAGVLRPRLNGDCYYHHKLKVAANGGLPTASIDRPLDILLARANEEAESAWMRRRGLADRLGWEDIALLENRGRK